MIGIYGAVGTGEGATDVFVSRIGWGTGAVVTSIFPTIFGVIGFTDSMMGLNCFVNWGNRNHWDFATCLFFKDQTNFHFVVNFIDLSQNLFNDWRDSTCLVISIWVMI